MKQDGLQQDDVTTLQKDIFRDSTIKQQRRIIRIFIAITILLSILVLSGVALNYYTHIQTSNLIDSSYHTMLQGMYSVQKTTYTMITPLDQRIDSYMRKGKRIILEHVPKTDFTDDQINKMLDLNWELSQMFLWSPYWALAYGAEESDFHNNVASFAGAQDWLQWMPGSIRETLGDLYIPGMERDMLWGLRAWYRRMAIAAQIMDNDPLWMACYYMLPDAAVVAKARGQTPDQFMKWLVQEYPGNDVLYPEHIKKYFDDFSNSD